MPGSPESFRTITRATDPWPTLGPASDACAAAGGSCTAGKLIGCRTYSLFFEYGISTCKKCVWPLNDRGTCQDNYFGHGSMIAGIAAGNAGAAAVQAGGHTLSAGGMSGMAPAAGLVMYKVTWTDTGTGANYGWEGDVMMAVDQAITDGVDVINYSLGDVPYKTWWMSWTNIAFWGAARAGVFIAAAAGNNRLPKTVENTVPWITVATAGTHSRKEGAGRISISGAGVTAASWEGPTLHYDSLGPLPVFYAGKKDKKGSACAANSLTAAAAAGKFVICVMAKDYPKFDPSEEVGRVGGAGMVLVGVYPDFEVYTVSACGRMRFG
jgi:hypothetical protein